jgi:hypothetical protein
VTTFSQRTFAGGEIAPALYARVDTAKYVTGARQLRNVYVMRHGGAQNRPGFSFVAEVKDSSKRVRLIEFVFNNEQTYVLEFGHQYMRVHKAGGPVLLPAQNISGITNANPAVLTYVGADTFANGDEVFISGVVGPIGQYVNGRNFKVANVNTGAKTFQLNFMDGTPVNSTTWGAYTSGGTVREVYEIETPYVEADLQTINFVQSADVLTLVHPNYAPREVRRIADDNWLFAPIKFEPRALEPTGLTATAGTFGSNIYRYRVTAVSETGDESLLGLSVTTATITGITQADPPVVTTSSLHPFNTGDEAILSGIVGMTELNNRRFSVTRLSPTTFSLDDEDSTGYAAYVSGGTATATSRTVSCAPPTLNAPNVVSWVAALPHPSGGRAVYYNIYQARADGNYGFLGTSTTTSFNDIGAAPDYLSTPPRYRRIFDRANRYPAAVAYIQERLAFGGSNNLPEQVELSRSGAYYDFRRSIPIQADDAFSFSVTGSQVNRVRHMMDIGALGLFTSGAEHACLGDNGVLLPTAINRKEQSQHGCSDVRPLKLGKTVLFIQREGNIVRDFLYDFQVDGYNGNDLTLFASHLFDGKALTDWCYQKVPHQNVWVVRDDGLLLGLAYVREQQILAWHRHDTDGVFENVCAIPEGRETAVYAVVRRTIQGQTRRYIERMESRLITDVRDIILMDSALSYDGRHTGSTTMTLSGGTNWTHTETLTLTASSATFTSSDVDNEIQLTGADGTKIRFTIDAFTSATVVTGRAHKTVPLGMRNVAISKWAKAVRIVGGLWHLEGKQVSVFGDGFVVGSPKNPSYTVLTVTNGRVTLPKPYAVIHVGLPFLSDIELLDIDTDQAETLTDKRKFISRVTLTVESTRGIWTGPKPPTDDAVNAVEGLVAPRPRDSGLSYDDPPPLWTDNIDINIEGQWNTNGRVFIRQIDPVPMAILAVAPQGRVAVRK